MCRVVFVLKQKTAYERRISDWSSDVCSSDLVEQRDGGAGLAAFGIARADRLGPRQVRGREGEALGLRRRVAGGLHRSTSPNTMSMEPRMATLSASMWPRHM